MNFSLGRCLLELAQKPSRVALAWHEAGSSTPFGVTGCWVKVDPDLRCCWEQGHNEKHVKPYLIEILFGAETFFSNLPG